MSAPVNHVKIGPAKCRGCGAKIHWAEGQGNPHPIDATRCRVFRRDGDKFFWTDELVYVSHFHTCPKREQFYGKKS